MSTSSPIAGIDIEQPSDPIVRPRVIWMTRQIALDKNDRELYVKLTIKELATYAVFFVIFFSSFSGLFTYETYVVNREISSLFVEPTFSTYSDDDYDVSIKFQDIITMSHFWQFFHSILCDKLYEIPTGAAKETGNDLLYENKFLFRPRVRQVRVEEGHCEIRNQFKGLFQDCYVPYDPEYEDRASFGPKKGTRWQYSDQSKTQGVFYKGEIASYGAGGFYFDFPTKKIDAKTTIKDLEHDTWLNRGTRAVFVDFAIYNCNLNVICAVKLVFEFPASGGIVPSSMFRTVKLYRYVVADTLLTLIGMLAVVGFVVYFTLEEIFEIVYFRKDYITVFWNYIDFGIVALGWWVIGVSLTIAIKEKSSSVTSIGNVIASNTQTGRLFIEHLVVRHETLVHLTAYLFFLVCVKIIKYTDLNRTMTVVYLSVGRCFKIVAGYLVIMIFVVSAFATLGYFAFGAQVKGFSTMYDSVLSSLRILMRDFDYRSLEAADAWFTTFFFVFFTCVVIFVLLTMLVAIVFHAYFDVDVEQSLGDRQLYVSDKVSAFVDRTLARMGFHNWAARRHTDRLKDELDRRVTYQDVYKTLKRCRFTDTEVEKILAKYGIEPQKTVHEDEARQMFRDVLKDEPKSSNDDKMSSNVSDIKWLVERVDLLENALEDVHKKCDVVIARLDAIRVQLPTNYAEQNLQDNPP